MNFVKKNPKIFIISGKARSGKGTISKLIENYYANKKVITISFGHYIKDYAKRVSDWDGSNNKKPRELLQTLGIELIKNQIDDSLFIRRILEDMVVFSYFYDIIIVNDVRLIDEFNALYTNYPNLTSIRVNRLNFNNGLTDSEKSHKTEIDLDNFDKFDYYVENNDTLEEQINKILKEV